MRHLTHHLSHFTKSTLALALLLSVLSLTVSTMQVQAQTRSDAIIELKRRLQERLANDNRAPRTEQRTAKEETPADTSNEGEQRENFNDNADPRKTAIVGSWLGTTGEGNKILLSLTGDGIVFSSVQGEVSTIPELGVLSPGHGVWKYLGARCFTVTEVGILYDINNGHLLGFLKATPVYKINRAGDELSGTDKVEITDPDGNVVFTAGGETHYKRIKAE